MFCYSVLGVSDNVPDVGH